LEPLTLGSGFGIYRPAGHSIGLFDGCGLRSQEDDECPEALNHCHALALYFIFYNFCRIHKTLKVSPAMVAGVTDKLWNMEDIVALIAARDERIKAAEVTLLRAFRRL
jgi:hypothetical protein